MDVVYRWCDMVWYEEQNNNADALAMPDSHISHPINHVSKPKSDLLSLTQPSAPTVAAPHHWGSAASAPRSSP